MNPTTVARADLVATRLSAVQRELQPHGQVSEWTAGDLLDPAITGGCVGFVLTGQLQMGWRGLSDTHAMGMQPLGEGLWFGANNWLLDTCTPTLWLRANRLTRVVSIGVERLRALLEGEQAALDAPLRKEMLGHYVRYWVGLAERYQRAFRAPTKQRVLDVLHEAAHWASAMSHPEGTLVKISRALLAERVGCAPATAGKVLTRLVADGQVRKEGRRILLLGHQGRTAPVCAKHPR